MTDSTLLSSESSVQKQAQIAPCYRQILCSCKVTAPPEQRQPECIAVQRKLPAELTSLIFTAASFQSFSRFHLFIFGDLADIFGISILSLVPKCVVPKCVSPGSVIALAYAKKGKNSCYEAEL